jgi:hypothetical protein
MEFKRIGCAVAHSIKFLMESREVQRKILPGHPTHLAVKTKGENSLLEKQGFAEKYLRRCPARPASYGKS